MVFTKKDFLNFLSFIFTIFLVVYGFSKGYDLIEIGIYNLYFLTEIVTLLFNLIKKD